MGGGCGGVKTEKPSKCNFFWRKIRKECLALKKWLGKEVLVGFGESNRKKVAQSMRLK